MRFSGKLFKDGSLWLAEVPVFEAMTQGATRRQRQRSGLSLAEVAQNLGAKSRNAYARYERGDSLPTIEKLDELLRAVSAGRDLVVGESRGRAFIHLNRPASALSLSVQDS